MSRLVCPQNRMKSPVGFFVLNYLSLEQMITKAMPKTNWTRFQALNKDHTLLDLLRERAESGEDALCLESAWDLSDGIPGQDEAR